MSPSVRVVRMILGSRPVIDAIAVRQIISDANGGAATASCGARHPDRTEIDSSREAKEGEPIRIILDLWPFHRQTVSTSRISTVIAERRRRFAGLIEYAG